MREKEFKLKRRMEIKKRKMEMEKINHQLEATYNVI